MSKLNVGDRVEHKGQNFEGTIIQVRKDNGDGCSTYTVETDQGCYFYRPPAKRGHGYHSNDDYLVLIKPINPIDAFFADANKRAESTS